MWWICDSCLAEVESDPHSHSDWGGVITVQGPYCRVCDQKMDLHEDQDSERLECKHEWEWIIQPSTVNGPEERFKVCKLCGMEYSGSDVE